MDRSAAKATLQEARRIHNNAPADPLKSLVMDGTSNLGHTLHTLGFENVTVWRCHTHFKWQVSATVKRYAGLPKESRKSLPPEYHPLRKQFYRVLDVGTEGEAFIALEALRATVARLQSKLLLVALQQVEVSLPKILVHLRDPDLPATNNKIENFNQRLENLPTFKRSMQTIPGVVIFI